MTSKLESDILAFATAQAWEGWLQVEHASSPGIWLRLFKKGAGVDSVSHADALLAALCFGWIDGQLKPFDETSWLRRFLPRRPRSIWSKRNCELVEGLAAAGKMQARGLQEVEAAKADGRWDAAYDSPSQMTIPEDFLAALACNPAAKSFFGTLNKANTYAIAWRLQTAKRPQTRERRIREIIDMLARHKAFH